MIIELEPSEFEYIYKKLLPMPYNEVFSMVNKMEILFKEHNEQLEAKKKEDEKQSKKDGKK